MEYGKLGKMVFFSMQGLSWDESHYMEYHVKRLWPVFYCIPATGGGFFFGFFLQEVA